jgi:hypothetical protein
MPQRSQERPERPPQNSESLPSLPRIQPPPEVSPASGREIEQHDLHVGHQV